MLFRHKNEYRISIGHEKDVDYKIGVWDQEILHTYFGYGFSLFKTFAHRAGVLNYNPPALRVVTIVIRKNHLSAL